MYGDDILDCVLYEVDVVRKRLIKGAAVWWMKRMDDFYAVLSGDNRLGM